MATLNWRTVREVQLAEALIPNPNSMSQKLDRPTDVRVAFDGGLVHIDPRPQGRTDTECPVYVVPVLALKVIQYKETIQQPFMA
jgi:hypothetical protein